MEVDEEETPGTGDSRVGLQEESMDSSSQNTTPAPAASSKKLNPNDSKRMAEKQFAVRQKIEKYFHQLTQGCNRENCTNPNCASNPSQKKLSGNEAAVKAIDLLQRKAEICSPKTEEVAAHHSSSSSPSTSASTNRELTATQTGQTPMDTTGAMTRAPVTRETLNIFATHGVSNSTHSSDATSLAVNTNLGTPLITMDDLKKEFEVQKDEKSGLEIVKVKEIRYLTEESIDQVIAECKESEEWNMISGEKSEGKDPYLPLFHRLTEVFSNAEGLNRSFLNKPKGVDILSGDIAMDLELETEDPIEQLMKDKSKDVPDSSAPAEIGNRTTLSSALASYLSSEGDVALVSQGAHTSGLHRAGAIRRKSLEKKTATAPKHEVQVFSPTVDIEVVRRVYSKLQGIEQAEKALVRSLEMLALNMEVQLNIMRQLRNTTINLNIFVVIMENPSLHSPEYLVGALPDFCKAMAGLPNEAIAELAKWWSTYDTEILRKMVQCIQQLLTYKVLQLKLSDGDENEQLDDLHKSEVVGNAVKCLSILYHASLLGGTIDTETECATDIKSTSDFDVIASAMGIEDDDFGAREKKVWKDPLGILLGISNKDITNPVIPVEEFENELLNEMLSVYSDFTNFMIDNRVKSDQFTFMQYPFVLNTVNKTSYFFYDNKIQMLSGRRMMLLQSILHRSPISPYLRLKIRRNHIIDDALVRLELISNEDPQDLRKQLYVEFEDEQGVDEGGVSKEFFQLVVEAIFNPDYGMFTYNENTHMFWFNAHSFENKAQFKLIGIVLGLAIYNSCILDVKFPHVVYKKLMGKKARFKDLQQCRPDLYDGLKQLLEYEGNIEEDLMVTFSAEYHDMFDTQRKHELKPNGENIPVTKENRQEYVDLYVNWLLNESIAEQFNAFRIGFDLVMSKSPIKFLFRIDELEVLISGSQEYNFHSLESTTEYDSGFTKDSQTIQDFWSVVHEMTDEDKKKLLQFTTGTDRAPVGGLSQLKLIIARNGPDSDRWPAAHTCFNVILLPDYKNREKLKERLYKAITHAKGFGML